jgi:NAD(P)-dependent dehydrogenase (short-subunit alcohol dehydrogenase family)
MDISGKYSLKHKIAVITGGGGGIGRAIAITFAQAGAKVACLDIDPAKANETAKQAGSGATGLACDVSSEADTKKAVDQVVKTFGAIHVLVNGAAMSDPTATVLDLDLAAWNKVFGVNVGGAFLMSRWAIPHMAAARPRARSLRWPRPWRPTTPRRRSA